MDTRATGRKLMIEEGVGESESKNEKETILRCVNSFKSMTKSCSLIAGEK